MECFLGVPPTLQPQVSHSTAPGFSFLMASMPSSKVSPKLKVSYQLQPKTDSFDVLDDVTLFASFTNNNQQKLLAMKKLNERTRR